jgi:hypothetical protein
MESEPTEAYVIQSERWPPGEVDPAIFRVCGPGTRKWENELMTREEARAIAHTVNLRREFPIERHPDLSFALEIREPKNPYGNNRKARRRLKAEERKADKRSA